MEPEENDIEAPRPKKRSDRRRRTRAFKQRAVRRLRQIWGFSVGVCRTCGKRHYNGQDLGKKWEPGRYNHDWSEKRAMHWLKYGQADRKLDKYNSELRKPIHRPDERQGVSAEEQLGGIDD